MIKHQPGADPGAVVFDSINAASARGADVVLVDTAGRLHTKSNLMEELKKIRSAVSIDRNLFLMPPQVKMQLRKQRNSCPPFPSVVLRFRRWMELPRAV